MKIADVGYGAEEYDYNLCNIKFSVQYLGRAEQLKSFLRQYQVGHGSGDRGKLIVCRNECFIPTGPQKVFSGRYKGIPWKAAFFASSASGGEQVFFCAPVFLDFLALRIAVLPYLKQKIVELGGFSMPGSAFSYQGKTFLLFGYPGCGKTTLLLQALKMGTEFVGDEKLFVLPSGGGIRSFFNRIGLRYHTARKSGFWNGLAPADKRRLWLYRFISAASAKRVTFNIMLTPEELGIKKRVAGPEREKKVFVHLVRGGRKTLISPEEAARSILQYKEDYRRIYGDMFGAAAIQGEIRGRITSFFAKSACWRISSEIGIKDILDLSEWPG